jgi:hypothetical protein
VPTFGAKLFRFRRAAGGEPVDPALVVVWNPVGVVGERGGGPGVAELGRDVGDRRLRGQEVGRVRVAEIVEPEARQAGLIDGAISSVSQSVGMKVMSRCDSLGDRASRSALRGGVPSKTLIACLRKKEGAGPAGPLPAS